MYNMAPQEQSEETRGSEVEDVELKGKLIRMINLPEEKKKQS